MEQDGKCCARENSLMWAIYGIGISVLFIAMCATYLVARIVDMNWADWKLPAILGIIYFAIVPSAAMILSVGEVKKEIDKAGGAH